MEKPFSDAVRVGETLYVSGQIGVDDSLVPPQALEDEARLLMENLRRVLERHGMTMDQLVMVTIFTPDVSHFTAFNAIYVSYFSGRLPARAFIGSGPLLFGARFELTAIASESAASAGS